MKKWIVIAGLLLVAVSAFAAPVTITFTAFQPPLGNLPGWQRGYPYTATVNGVAGLAVMCDDWFHGGVPGDSWQTNFTNLGTINPGNISASTLRFNLLPNAATLYDEVGWLILQTEVQPRSTWTDINTAVWYIFDQNTIMTPGAFYWVDQAVNEANIGFPGVNFHLVDLYTPLNQYGVDSNGQPDPNLPQEVVTVPEPTTLALLAGGLLGVWRRRRVC